MNNELLERVTFKDVFETKEIFKDGWDNSGYSGITSTNVNIIYNLLYARYCNSTVASIDIDRFKSQVYAIMYMHGPAWQKKQAIQDYIYALQEDDIRIGSTTVLNTAQNPSTAPATDAFEALTKIDSQNASRTISSPIKAYAELRTLVEDGFTETFIDKFKKLFIVVLDTNCNLPPILRVRGNHIYTGDTLPDIGYPYWDGDLFVKTNGEIYQYNTTEWTFILSMAGELTPEILLDKIEGSDYISVDMNETDDKVKIELDKLDTEVTEDSDNLITSGAVFDYVNENSGKLVEVTYGVTTYDEIAAIVDDGKLPYLFRNNVKYDYDGKLTNQYYYFSNIAGSLTESDIDRIACTPARWTTGTTNIEKTSNKENTITPSSTTKYPSSKAVADYVAQHSGGGAASWGNITGTLDDQIDLKTALDGKAPKQAPITGYNYSAYVVRSNGTQTALATSDTPAVGILPRYGQNGQLSTLAPTSNNHCTNKKYVDDNIVEKVNGVFELNGTDLYITTY